MEMAMSELPLAFFTTLSPIGAGAFIALALAFFTTDFTDEVRKKIDVMTIIPLAVIGVGFLASFFHLASPLNAIGVFNGVGSSPLSNEIAAGVLFVIVAALYWILCLTGKLAGTARKALVAVVAVLAVVFAYFCGAAYMMNTIASWNTPLVPVSTIGYCLMGGVFLGCVVLAAAQGLTAACETTFKSAALAVVVVGALMALAGVCVQFTLASALPGAAMTGSQMTPYVVAFAVCSVAGVVLGGYSLLKKADLTLQVAAVIAVTVGVFCARLAFYALEIGVGL